MVLQNCRRKGNSDIIDSLAVLDRDHRTASLSLSHCEAVIQRHCAVIASAQVPIFSATASHTSGRL